MSVDKVTTKENSTVAINIGNGDEKGVVQISNNVVASIVRKYVLAIDGVVRPAPQSLVEGLASMLSRRGYENSINIELAEDGAIITLALILRFGTSVAEVSKEIQDVLFDKIPALAGYQVAKVNVNVVDLEEEEADSDEDATIVSDK